MKQAESEDKRLAAGYVGWSITGLYLVGTASFVVGCYVFYANQDGTGTGLCWIAAALSFGYLLNGLMRR